jgi:O-antigen/teichoic acid export membrane protein
MKYRMKKYDRYKKIFKSNDKRNNMLYNNIILSAVLKIIGLSCSLLIVPITLNYLNKEVYGIWLTMSSILYWFSFFDIGLGNGMRNYLTQAISNDNYELGRSYLSTTLLMLFIIAIIIAVIAIVPMSLLNLNNVFNTKAISGNALRNVMIVSVIFTLALFVVKNIGFVFVALQKYAFNDLLLVSGNIISLLIIYVLTKTTEGNLMYVVMAFTITPVIVFLLASIPIFIKYPQLKPNIKSIDKSLGHQIVGKGLGFFFIQITSCLVIYGSSNLFITQFCGPSTVTVYNIAYKYFNLIAIAYTIVISPMWNAYTDAYVKGDMQWISHTFNHALKMWMITIIGGFVMLAISGVFYHFWIGKSVVIPFSVSASVLAYIGMFNLNNCATYLLNGLNKIRVQIYTSFIFTVFFLIVVTLLGRNFGVIGIILSMTISYGLMSMIHLYQCRLLIKQKAKGIWNK